MKRSTNLKQYFTEWSEKEKQFEAEIQAIKNNSRLSESGKDEDLAKLGEKIEKERTAAVAKYRLEWHNIRSEYVAKGETASPADRTAALQTIIALGKNMTPQMLNDVLEPIKKDPAALRLVRPVIENQGLNEVFAETSSYKYIDAVCKMENYLKEADSVSKKVETEEDRFKTAILKNYMFDFLNAAEEQLELVREQEAKFNE